MKVGVMPVGQDNMNPRRQWPVMDVIEPTTRFPIQVALLLCIIDALLM